MLGWVMSGQEAGASPANRRVTPNRNIQLEVGKGWSKVVCENAHKGDAGSSRNFLFQRRPRRPPRQREDEPRPHTGNPSHYVHNARYSAFQIHLPNVLILSGAFSGDGVK